MPLRAGAAALVVLALAGCSRGDGETSLARASAPAAAGDPEPAAGEALLRFVRAARRGDAAAMWALLSRETRAGAGGTLGRFRGDLAADLADQFELVEGERLVLARRLGRFAVAAVAARRAPEEGEELEAYSYAAALVGEQGAWRLELAGVAIELLRPGPLDEVGERPELGARAAAAGRVRRMLLWLDGHVQLAAVTRELPFLAELESRPRRPLAGGVHHAVVYAEGGGTAAAVAWPFTVE